MADPELKVKIKLDGLNQFKAGLKNFNSQLATTKASFANLGAAIKNSAAILATFAVAAAGAAAAVFGLTRSNAEFNDTIAKNAQQIGVSTKFLQEYGFAIEQLGGNQEGFVKGLGIFAKNVGELQARGTGLLDTFFKEFDPQLLSLLKNTKSVEESFQLVIARLRAIPDEQKRIAAASQLFGTRTGRAIAQFSRQSNAEIEALLNQVRSYGAVLSDEALARSEEFIDAQNRLRTALRGTSRQITSNLEPSFIRLFDALTQTVVNVQPKLISFFADFAQKYSPIIGDFIRIMLGEFLIPADERTLKLVEAFNKFKEISIAAVDAVTGAFKAFFGVLDPIAKIFGSTGEKAGLTLLVLQFTGVLNVLVAALGFVFNAAVTLWGALKLGPASLLVLQKAFLGFVTFMRVQVLSVIVTAWLSSFGIMASATSLLTAGFAAVRAAAAAAWLAVTGPIGIIVAGVALVGAGLALLIEKTIGWKNIWDAVVQAVKDFGSFIAKLPAGLALIGKLFAEWAKFFGPILFEEFKQAVMNIISTVLPLLLAGFENLVSALGPIIQSIAGLFKDIFDGVLATIGDAFSLLLDTLAKAATSILDKIKGLFSSTIDTVKRAVNSVSSAVSGRTSASTSVTVNRGDVLRRATGGLISGPGSGTSDSIPMFGSNGEFMMRVAAVRKYGVGFMEAINSGTLKLKKFAQGGLIGDLTGPAVSPALAGVPSPGSSGRPLQLQMPGGGNIRATVPESTAKMLERDLRRNDFAKTGRLPRWYK